MRRRVPPAAWVAAAPALLVAGALAGGAALLWATTDGVERGALLAVLVPRVALLFALGLVLAVGAGVLALRLWQRHGGAAGRLAEAVRVRVAGDGAGLPPWDASAEPTADGRALAAAVATLLAERDALRADLARRVEEASREVAQERNRLAALMAELTQSVVVCNIDGRVLLFNARARLQFQALAGAADGGRAIGGAEPLGLGRSVYTVLDRRLVEHALEAVQQRLQRGAAHPSAQFVTATRGGQLLRVQLAPVRGGDDATEAGADANDVPIADHAPAPAQQPQQPQQPQLEVQPQQHPQPPPRGDGRAAPLAGFVLMLDNVTRDLADDLERDRLLHGLTEGSRSSLGNLQAAIELLDDPALDAATHERLLAVVRDEIGVMARRLDDAATRATQASKTRWPLEDMLGADLVAVAVTRIESAGRCRATVAEVDPALWLRVDSYALLLSLQYLAGKLVDEFGVTRVRLRLQRREQRAQLDLVWMGQAVSTETVAAWETKPLNAGADAAGLLTLRDVVERHGGAFWFERERARQEAFFRFLLPLAGDHAPLDAAAVLHAESRPAFYDFDLFARTGADVALAERRLVDLAFTVFDCETTGLDPSAGDQIIQIGAVRVVAGKLRGDESFDQLVDPQRSLPAAGIAVHGIQPAMLRGQPTIAEVLPAFHRYAHDTVLVAHNAAFDMRFLQLQEQATGVRFDQPVLDTMLLSALVHPQQTAHRLEAIAERLGVPVLGRHTAIGDALVTAEVLLRMLPLLQAIGIATLGQAIEASRATARAGLRY